jgi:hypothetical protein
VWRTWSEDLIPYVTAYHFTMVNIYKSVEESVRDVDRYGRELVDLGLSIEGSG